MNELVGHAWPQVLAIFLVPVLVEFGKRCSYVSFMGLDTRNVNRLVAGGLQFMIALGIVFTHEGSWAEHSRFIIDMPPGDEILKALGACITGAGGAEVWYQRAVRPVSERLSNKQALIPPPAPPQG